MKTGDKIKFMRNTQSSKGVTIGKVYEVVVATYYTNNIDSDDLVNGNAVYLESDDSIATLKDVEEAKNTIKLTDDYDATIDGDIVKVGCQSIPIDKVREIITLWENLNY